ncbi:MAG: hypothetical protein KAT65_28955 [Methanophagales archaeon]|nr:hypothetical protein [Methanophagales archaeon]
MTKSESKNLPHFRSLDELVTFFDTYDLGEYGTEMPKALEIYGICLDIQRYLQLTLGLFIYPPKFKV